MGKVWHVDAIYPPLAIARHTDDHEFHRLAAGIFKGMHLVQLDRDRIARPDRGKFGTATLSRIRDGTLAAHDIVEFGHLAVQVGARRSMGEAPGGPHRPTG